MFKRKHGGFVDKLAHQRFLVTHSRGINGRQRFESSLGHNQAPAAFFFASLGKFETLSRLNNIQWRIGAEMQSHRTRISIQYPGFVSSDVGRARGSEECKAGRERAN
jgi:hypothetical protein